MPRSSKAPPLPPEPDVNELIQNDVARIKRLLGLDVNRLALGSEVEGIVTGGPFGSNDYTITGASTIEFVNVSTSLGPAQGGSGFPPQVTGLTVTPHAGSNTQLDLTWTASGLPDFNFYNVYQGTVSGFIADSSSEIAQPVTNSYNNTGLDTGTTYYYRVSTTNDALLEGPVSSEVSGTTTTPVDITPPPQTVGLATNVMSDTQINLTWTASTAGDLNHYDVHRSTTSGFTPNSGNRIFQPTANSYNNTGLVASTIYYYKVAAVDNSGNIGTYSAQASGTTAADTTPPAQVTGLTATVISDTQINLTWTASAAGDLNHYDVHRSTSTGFTPAVGNRISQPSTNSYNNTGLTASTLYYYKVAAVDNSGNIGTYSTQASGTTTVMTSITPSLELHFDGNLTDTSPNINTLVAGSAAGNGYLTPGQFGNALKSNYPSATDLIFYNDSTSLRMDPTVGFSISVWVYPVSFYTGSRKTIVRKRDDGSNQWYLQIEPSTLLVHFHVDEAATIYKRVTATGLTVNAWNHVVGTFNSSTNAIEVYKDAVAGNSSTAAIQFDAGTSDTYFGIGSDFQDSANTRFLGYLDELRYYKGTVLTSTQVTNLMNTNATGTGADTTPPGQVTGLAANVISDTQINLSWTASAAGDLNHYDVHRSTSTGFTPAVGNRISQPTANSYNNTGLTASTTYYYKVAAVDNASNIGTYSTQVTGTTTAAAGVTPTLLLHLDNDFTDSSGNGLSAALSPGFSDNNNGFVSPGKWGSHGLRLNYPTDNTATGDIDFINITDNPLIQMNTSVGFSVSFWVYPVDLTAAGPAKRMLIWKQDNSTNRWSITVDTAGVVYFCVQKAGVDYKRQISGFITNAWQHVCAVFNGATNTVALYKDGVAGVSSTTTPQYASVGSGSSHMVAGYQTGSIVNTHYEGRIDELQYFQAALTSTQVTNLINNNSIIAGNYHYTPSRTFNGISDFIDVPDSPSLDLNQFSISAWFRTSKDYHLPTDDPGGEAGIILVKTMWRTQEHVNYGMWVTDANGIRGGFLEADKTEHLAKSTDSGLPGANTVNDGQWHMANITYDGASVKCYIDAVLHDSRAASATPEILTTKMRIGANSFEGFESSTVGVHMYFKGELDEIYIWNKGLTAAEITALYTAGTVPQSGAIVYQNHF